MRRPGAAGCPDVHAGRRGARRDGPGGVRPTRAGELGLTSRVEFTPFLPSKELRKRFADFDILLFTTHRLEAFGLVAVEAQAHGLAVLFSDLPGLRDTLGSGALPYPTGDPHALATVIGHIVDAPEKRRALRTAASDNGMQHTAYEFVVPTRINRRASFAARGPALPA
ncbi:glycosyltransferase [Streptomyces sp. S1D4-11]|nr:glycosyltransferase [Streptomyces sp. S1D4-11]QIZ00695.1 glycosyltransferase family 4 protein [Streptomyces sp. S1D4-11]